jgi:hypothetical protein
MAVSSSRLANVLAAWLLLAGVAFISAGLLAALDQKLVADPDMLPLAHWVVRLHATDTADDRDEWESGRSHPSSASPDSVQLSPPQDLIY